MIRVFPEKNKWTPTDELAFVGMPPFHKPLEDMPVFVSVVFTWHIPLGQRIKKAWSAYYSDVRIGGPAFGDQGGDFVPGRFIKQGVTFTSRGCIRSCPWCFVPKREGKTIRELDIKPGIIVQDNNLLACSRKHIESVFNMCREQNKGITFSGGIDTRLLRKWHVDLFDSIKIKEMFFACDSRAALKTLTKTAELIEHIPQPKKRCYVLLGFDEKETLGEAKQRLEAVYNMGFYPYAQLFQSDKRKEYPKEWKALARKWARPAAYRSKKKESNQMLLPMANNNFAT